MAIVITGGIGICICVTLYSQYSLSYMILGIMLVIAPVLTINAIHFYTIHVPSDAHICDLRLAVAKQLHVDPRNLELFDMNTSCEDTHAILSSPNTSMFMYVIRDHQARGVIANLYS